jgi:ribonuclease HII
MTRTTPNLKEEKRLWQKGHKVVAGIDESGCGPWAGPLVAAAVILPLKRIKGVRDSKLLSTNLREKLYKKIYREALDINLAFINPSEIDKLGIRLAAITAMKNALEGLKIKPDFVLVDAFRLSITLPQKAVIKGDRTCLSIAAASIIAKVERDRVMIALHKDYPTYRFDRHKGYGTRLHQEMLKKYGPSKIHRRSYKPIKDLLT